MIIGYIRVSTEEQNIDRQVEMLKQNGVDKVFIDKMSGKNTQRPALQEMLTFMREKDTVIVESISRLARNTRDLLKLVDKFKETGVEFISLKENIDTTTPTGQFVLVIFAAIADLERTTLLQRQAEGIAIAKGKGIYKGKKSIDCPDFDRLYEETVKGLISVTRARELCGLSQSSWYRRVHKKQQSAKNSSCE